MFLANSAVHFTQGAGALVFASGATSNLMLCETIIVMSKRHSSHAAGIPLLFPTAEGGLGGTVHAHSKRQHKTCRQIGNFCLSVLHLSPQLCLGNDAVMSAVEGFFTEIFNTEEYQNYLIISFFHHDQYVRGLPILDHNTKSAAAC